MGDHTWIPMECDPTKQRMSGYARHGNTPFDVPFISHLRDGLYQGGCATGLILPDAIVHIVSLYPWERYTVQHEMASELYVTMYDAVDQGFNQVDRIAEWVVACWEQGPTLIHCQAGLNRSSLIAARAMMLGAGISADEAIATLRRERSPACLCNGHFEQWLRGLQA